MSLRHSDGYKMHVIFLIGFQVILLYQNGLTREVSDIAPFPNEHKPSYERINQNGLIQRDHALEKRSMSDIWNSIKNSAVKAWSTIKEFAKKTGEKIKVWVQNVKNQADRIKEELKKRLDDLKNKLKNMIKKVFGAGEVVKKCLQEQNEAFDQALLGTVQGVTSCISDKIKGVSLLENYDKEAMLNDTSLIEQVESKLNTCVEDSKQVEECLQNVRKYILDETEKIEDNALKTRLETRGIVDDILAAITTCSMDGLMEASAVIASVSMNVVQCIAEA